MSGKYKVGDNQIPHFITFSTVNWIDALTRNEYKDIVVESLKHCIKEKGMVLNAWVIMSNHVHLIFSAKQGYQISNILRDMKKFTSKQIIETIKNNPHESRKEWMVWMFERAGKRNANNEQYQFWQQDNHPVEPGSPEIPRQRLNYLHENPVRAGIVYKAQDYVYSNATNYYTAMKGRIEVQLL